MNTNQAEKKPAGVKPGKAKRILSIIGNTVLWLFVVFAVVVTVLVFSSLNNQDGLSNIGGKSLVTILSDSMSPTFNEGDLLLVNPVAAEDKSKCKVGEVITFYADLNGDGKDDINTHRITEVKEEGGYVYYKTRGDNPKIVADDPWTLSYTKVLGKYEEKSSNRIRFVGKAISFLQTSTGFMCVIVIPLVLFFLFELYNFITVLVKLRVKGKVSAEDEAEIKRRAIEEYLRQQAAAQGTAADSAAATTSAAAPSGTSANAPAADAPTAKEPTADMQPGAGPDEDASAGKL